MISSLDETSFRPWTGALPLVRPWHLSAACAEEPTAAAQAPRPPTNPDQVVAEVAGKPITLKDVDAKWEEFDAAERARVVQALYQNRRNMLEQIVGDELIDNAAKAAGQPVTRSSSRMAPSACRAITEAEIARSTSRTRIARRAARSTSCAARSSRSSRSAASSRHAPAGRRAEEEERRAVKVMLDPPRYTVPTPADDPVRGNPAAPVTIVEFSDYQCPFCARVDPTLDEDPPDLRRSRQDRVQGFPAAESRRGAEGRRSRALRRRAEQILGDARRDVRQPARAGSAGAQAGRARHRARRRDVRSVPGFRQARGGGPRRHASSARRWA